MDFERPRRGFITLTADEHDLMRRRVDPEFPNPVRTGRLVLSGVQQDLFRQRKELEDKDVDIDAPDLKDVLQLRADEDLIVEMSRELHTYQEHHLSYTLPSEEERDRGGRDLN